MGRKKKFGEESDFVSVRVPKSKRKEYRTAINHFVEKKFATESVTNTEDSKDMINKKELNRFRKFDEFMKEIKKKEKEKSLRKN